MSIEQQIGEEIRAIANQNGAGITYPVMSGSVVAGSYDGSAYTVSVLLSVNDIDKPTGGILTNVVLQNADGLTLVPADGSEVWVAELDGPGKWGIIKCSTLVSMKCVIGSSSFTMTDGLFQFNDGSNNGLVMGARTAGQLNLLENDVNNLKTLMVNFISAASAAASGPGASSPVLAGVLAGYLVPFTSWATNPLEMTEETDIEETAVTH